MSKNLFIQIKNDIAFEHPITEENLRYFYPDLDIDNPPEGYAKFIRKSCPELSPIQILESTEYVIDPDFWPSNIPVYTDKYNIRELTEEELIELANEFTQVSNEKMQKDSNAPYPAPEDGNLYVWSSQLNEWISKPDNFDEVVSKFTEELTKLGLIDLTPDELQKVDSEKLKILQKIIDEINTNEGIENLNVL